MIDRKILDDLTAWITEEVRLPIQADRELQLAALLSAVLDALTRIGPNTTLRVLEWAFKKYGIEGTPYKAQDRRPPPPPVVVASPPAVPQPQLTNFCHDCKRQFATVQGYKAHIRIAHEGKRIPR